MVPEIDENPESRSVFEHVFIPVDIANRLADFKFLRRKAVGLDKPEVELAVFSYASKTLYAVSYYEGSLFQRDLKKKWLEDPVEAEALYEQYAVPAREMVAVRGDGDPFKKMESLYRKRHSCLLVPSKVYTKEEDGFDMCVVDVHIAEIADGLLVVFTSSCGLPPIQPIAKILPYRVYRGEFGDECWGFFFDGENVSTEEVVEAVWEYCLSRSTELGELVDAAVIAERVANES